MASARTVFTVLRRSSASWLVRSRPRRTIPIRGQRHIFTQISTVVDCRWSIPRRAASGGADTASPCFDWVVPPCEVSGGRKRLLRPSIGIFERSQVSGKCLASAGFFIHVEGYRCPKAAVDDNSEPVIEYQCSARSNLRRARPQYQADGRWRLASNGDVIFDVSALKMI